MTELDFLSKFAEFGANGMLVGTLVLLGRWYLPRLDKLVDALNTIALNLATLSGDVQTAKQSINETRGDLADVREDVTGIYTLLRQPQPSRGRRAAAATGSAR